MTRSIVGKIGKPSKRKPARRQTERVNIERTIADGTAIDAAVNRGVRTALKEHKRAGNPIAVWSEGKVVWIEPEDIPV